LGKIYELKMKNKTLETKEFYDVYWPANLPDFKKTREHVLSLLPPERTFRLALDAGCGTGVCSLALSERAEKVIAVDISTGALNTAVLLTRQLKKENIEFSQANLLNLPFDEKIFDLVFSWGVIHHTVDPLKALDELVRVLKKGGILILAVYLKTRLTFFHEAIRRLCLNLPAFMKKVFIKTITLFVWIAEKLGKKPIVRADNPLIESQVEDWFFVPEKHFFTIDEMRTNFYKRNLSFELLCAQTGRFKSSSNFIVRGIKN
jgi:ubiquinone/menaquinone biosynthesis C-methylase UbiE